MPSYEDLEARVINTGECTVCGACILACPSFHIKFTDGKPSRPKRTIDCVGCTICYDACYMLRHDLMKAIESRAIGWGRAESIGLHRSIMAARARDPDITKVCQDGGVVTALITYALDSGIIDGALVVGQEDRAPVACIAAGRDDVIRAAGTKYGVVPVLKALRAAVVDRGLSRICVVGSPCHIQAIRYLKYKGLPLASSASLMVGLFCRENYEYACLGEKVRGLGVDLAQVDRLDVSGEFEVWVDGRRLSLPVTDVKSCVPRHCLVCQDFAAELADIAIGSGGSAGGWSTTIVRTEIGEKVLAGMVEQELVETSGLVEILDLKELASRKKQKGQQTREIFKLKEIGLETREIAARLGITEERVSHRLEGA
jgi:coenzyme F420-reducing hydrogenase beta subunit